MKQRNWHLSNCDIFAGLPADEIQHIEARSLTRQFKRGASVYLPTDCSDGVFLLVKGRVKICHVTPQGKQSILSFVNPGELFGELAMVSHEQRRDEFAQTMEKSQIVLISNRVMTELMERHTGISIGITKLIGLRRQRIEMRLKHLLFHSNRERLIHLILELAEQFGVKSNEGTLINIRLSHQELGNLIGSTRESVTILLGDFQKEGLIKVLHRKIIVTNLTQIAQAVEIAPIRKQPASETITRQPSFGYK